MIYVRYKIVKYYIFYLDHTNSAHALNWVRSFLKILFGFEVFLDHTKNMNGIVLMKYYITTFIINIYFVWHHSHEKSQEIKWGPVKYKGKLTCHIFFQSNQQLTSHIYFWLNQNYDWNCSHNIIVWIFYCNHFLSSDPKQNNNSN